MGEKWAEILLHNLENADSSNPMQAHVGRTVRIVYDFHDDEEFNKSTPNFFFI